jgi:hypothetical protein
LDYEREVVERWVVPGIEEVVCSGGWEGKRFGEEGVGIVGEGWEEE